MMADTKNTQVVRRMFAAWNAHDVERFVKLLDPSTVWESDSLPAALRGHAGARELYRMWVGAFPDLHLDIEQLIASGRHVVVRWRAKGTHQGDMMGVPPTKRSIEVHGSVVHELRNGKHVHAWLYWDNAHLLRQLGGVPGRA